MEEYAFSRLKNNGIDLSDSFGIYHFESLSLGIQPFLDQLDPLNTAQMQKLKDAIISLKKEPEFVTMTKGGGKNSIGLLKKRIAFATTKLSKIL